MLLAVKQDADLEEKLTLQWRNLLRVQTPETLNPLTKTLFDWYSSGTIYEDRGQFESEYFVRLDYIKTSHVGRRFDVECLWRPRDRSDRIISYHHMWTYIEVYTKEMVLGVCTYRIRPKIYQESIKLRYSEESQNLEFFVDGNRIDGIPWRLPPRVSYEIEEDDIVPILIHGKNILEQHTELCMPEEDRFRIIDR